MIKTLTVSNCNFIKEKRIWIYLYIIVYFYIYFYIYVFLYEKLFTGLFLLSLLTSMIQKTQLYLALSTHINEQIMTCLNFDYRLYKLYRF